jgi:shikimate kinase
VTRPTGPERGPLVVLCGPMGSGKTAVGSALARRWGVSVRDTDHDIVEATGLTIPELFDERGEAGFRELEHRVVAQALVTHAGVLALGGGAVVLPESRAVLADYVARGGHVVFLDVDVETAMARVGGDRGRPLLSGDPRGRWTALMAERRPLYTEVATVRVRADGRSPAKLASQIERRLEAG